MGDAPAFGGGVQAWTEEIGISQSIDGFIAVKPIPFKVFESWRVTATLCLARALQRQAVGRRYAT